MANGTRAKGATDMVSRDTDVTLLYSATLVSLHLSVVTGSKPFGPDPCPHPALAGRKRTRYLSYLFKPLLMRHSLKDAEIPRTASHAAGPLWTPARLPNSTFGGAGFSDSRVGGRVGNFPPCPTLARLGQKGLRTLCEGH